MEKLRLGAAEVRFLQALGLLSGLCLGLFGFRLLSTGVSRYWFIPENLMLAWAALITGWALVRLLRNHLWSNWQCLLLSGLWILFLPNAWYVMSDFIHLSDTGEISFLFDIALLLTLTITGFLLGLTSLRLVHKEIRGRLDKWPAWLLIELVILASSFAVYLGRDLRWNTWDLVTDPGGLVLSVTDRLINPFGYPRALNVTVIFFVTISISYIAYMLLARPVVTKE